MVAILILTPLSAIIQQSQRFINIPASILEIFEFLWTVGVEWAESLCPKMEALLIDIYISIDIYTYIDINIILVFALMCLLS